jgi:hypothetical protein
MNAIDVPPHWTDAARSAYEDAWEQGHPPYRSMMHAIAAVAPLIAKAERERCADVAERFGVVAHGALETEPWAVQQQAGREISAAVRALPDA